MLRPHAHAANRIDLSDVFKKDGKEGPTFREQYQDWKPLLWRDFSDYARPLVRPGQEAVLGRAPKMRSRQLEYIFEFDEEGFPILTTTEGGRPMNAERLAVALRNYLVIHWCECLVGSLQITAL